jgi:hypothetical protein
VQAPAIPHFVAASSSLDGLPPHDGVLTPSELEELARRLALRPELWRPLIRVDRERRRYELLYEDDRLDAWVLSWMPQQATGFHDHDASGVGLAVAQGSVREDWMRYAGGHVEWPLQAGDSRAGGPGYVHRVQHAAGEPAVTIHVYSPRLEWVGQYRVDDAGILRREVQPGRLELTAQRTARGALGSDADRF